MYSVFAAWGYSKYPSRHKSTREIGERGREVGVPPDPSGFPFKIGLKPSEIIVSPVGCSRLRLTTGVHVAHYYDEFRGPGSDTAEIRWRTGDYFPPLQFTCRNCGGGDRGRVAIYRPFGELLRAKIVLSPVWCSRPTTGVPLAHATMNFVGLVLTTSDSDEAHFWLNGYGNKQNCHIWSEANPQVYVETPLHLEKLTVWCALWAGGILLQKR
ncbi:hypothetical protein TNCV_940551 [Trichonephila clavipes]|nr:hypothetical protein TNCV_940551 [Trichonephila clavipes]